MSPPPPFTSLLPEVESRLRRRFGHLDPDRRDECVQEATAQAWALYRSAVLRRNTRFTPFTLSHYAAMGVAEGRHFAGYTTTDALDRNRAVGLDDLDADGRNVFAEALIQRQTSPLDAARIVIDWPQFTSTLTGRERWMIEELAVGSTKTEIASEAGLSSGRISQIFADVADQYEDYLGTPGFEVRARHQGRPKPGRKPKAARAA